jgi:hypothetical protein
LAEPRVFISHASEDHDFVDHLAARLRQDHGIDAWVDGWEMLPGDSLVDKIFDKGIAEADAIILVLSSASVVKPWVREEINSSFVRKVEERIRLIPVVLDDCTMPTCLLSTVHERVTDRVHCDGAVRRIAASIHGVYEKPEIGPAPDYARTSEIALPDGLSKIDAMVLAKACQLAWDAKDYFVSPHELEQQLAEQGLGKEQVFESLDMLEDECRIDCGTRVCAGGSYPGAGISMINICGTTLVDHAGRNGRKEEIWRVMVCIVNDEPDRSSELAEKSGLDEFLCQQVLRCLDEQGHVQCIEACGGEILLDSVSTPFRRLVRDQA